MGNKNYWPNMFFIKLVAIFAGCDCIFDIHLNWHLYLVQFSRCTLAMFHSVISGSFIKSSTEVGPQAVVT